MTLDCLPTLLLRVHVARVQVALYVLQGILERSRSLDPSLYSQSANKHTQKSDTANPSDGG